LLSDEFFDGFGAYSLPISTELRFHKHGENLGKLGRTQVGLSFFVSCDMARDFPAVGSSSRSYPIQYNQTRQSLYRESAIADILLRVPAGLSLLVLAVVH
jgi:hypothetical protein